MKVCDWCGKPIKKTVNNTDYSYKIKKYCNTDCRMAADYLYQSISLCKKIGITVNILRFTDNVLTLYIKI
jgi:hypothetical protein